MRTLITMVALIASAPALAIDHGVDVNVGGMFNGDATYDQVTGRTGLVNYGLSGTVRLIKYVGVLASYNHAQSGAVSDYNGARTAYYTDQWGLGVRAGIPVTDWFQPIASAQFLLHNGTMKLDSDPQSSINAGQVTAQGLAPGGQFLGGVEFAVPRKNDAPVTAAFTIEAGYTFVGNHSYDNATVHYADGNQKLDISLGDMSVSSFTLRVGAGVRF